MNRKKQSYASLQENPPENSKLPHRLEIK